MILRGGSFATVLSKGCSMTKRQKILVTGVFGVLLAISALLYLRGQPSKQGTLTVAAVLPMTGWSAEFGHHEWYAVQAATDRTRAVHPDLALDLVLKDTRSETANAVTSFQSLEMAPQMALVESSAASFAIAPLLEPRRTIMLSVSTNPEVTRQSEYIFRSLPTADEETVEVLRYALDESGLQRLALLYINNDYGTGFLASFDRNLKSRNRTLAYSDAFASETTDFRPLVEKLKASGADSVFIVGYGSAMGNLIVALRAQAFAGHVMACSSVIYDDVLSVAGEAASGIAYADIPFSPDTSSDEGQFFLRRYRELSGKEPSPLAAMVYDSSRMILEALVRENYDPAAARSALLAQGTYEGINGTILIPASRDLQFGLVMKRVP